MDSTTMKTEAGLRRPQRERRDRTGPEKQGQDGIDQGGPAT
jgi:hypothetical protein